MHDPTDYKRELAAIQIILAASAQRQPAVTSLATLCTVIQHQRAIQEDLQAIRALLEALVDRLPPPAPASP
jgi:hypothetical protein